MIEKLKDKFLIAFFVMNLVLAGIMCIQISASAFLNTQSYWPVIFKISQKQNRVDLNVQKILRFLIEQDYMERGYPIDSLL